LSSSRGDWRIVAEHELKGVAVERAITGVETTVVTNTRDARQVA